MLIVRYSGAGNSFLVIDGRNGDAGRFTRPDVVHALCLIHGADGLMVMEKSECADFRMLFFNPDGSCGMFCGNGGRCIVAFADYLGVKPFHTRDYVFEAPDGLHRAEILSHLGECKVVRLEMRDVPEVRKMRAGGCEGLFADTGARHFVVRVPDVESVDVAAEGSRLRCDQAFAPEGTNVDFVSLDPDGTLRIRTFEKGVEGETLACGTGVTAAALCSAAEEGAIPVGEGAFDAGETDDSGRKRIRRTVRTREDTLEVDFLRTASGFTSIRLTGPTLFEGELDV